MASTYSPRQSVQQTAQKTGHGVPYGVDQLYLNHPRSYFIVPIAVAHDLDTASLIQKHAAGSGSQAKTGAEVLGLIDSQGNLTDRGQIIVHHATAKYESHGAALTDLHSLEGSSTRFVEQRPHWAVTARETALAYKPAASIAQVLADHGPSTLPTLVSTVADAETQAFARELFLQNGVETPFSRLEATGTFESPGVYRGTTTYQLKTCLYHCGVLTERGSDTSNLQPKESVWALTDAAHEILRGDGNA